MIKPSMLAARRRIPTTLCSLVALSLLGGCDDGSRDVDSLLQASDDDQTGAVPAGAGDLTTTKHVGAFAGFDVDISVAGGDVVLDWSAAGNAAGASVLRSTDPAILIGATTGAPPAGADVFTVVAGTTSYTDVGAASQTIATPRYFYRVVSNGELSTLLMKNTTAMAPGYNKLGMCMLGGPTHASDVVAQLGSSVTGVWAWDAVNQSYVNWTPAQGVGTAADFALPFGGVFAAQVDGSTPAYQSLVGVVPTNESFVVTGQPGYNWSTLPVLYDGAPDASYWVETAGYWGMGQWNNLTQSASWYWNSNHPDFGIEGCGTYYMYLPDNACTSNDDCAGDKFCHFVDEAACGDVAAGLCTAMPIGCEYAPEGDVCGCDDVTYESACEAGAAGVSVAAEGACEPPPPPDSCAPNPCANGGECTSEGLAYTCSCPSGWTGPT
ncbi:MAG: calcium-binding EGF-like domain-containing protein, partial [Nannocystaceae bacterium]